jgi:hypothetical protein
MQHCSASWRNLSRGTSFETMVGKQIPDYPPSLDATMTLFRERDHRYHPGRHEAKRQLGQIDIVHGLSSRLGCHYRAAVLAVRFFRCHSDDFHFLPSFKRRRRRARIYTRLE